MKSDSEILAEITKDGTIDMYGLSLFSRLSTTLLTRAVASGPSFSSASSPALKPFVLPRQQPRLTSLNPTPQIATDNFPKPSAAELNATQNAPLQPPQLLQQPTEPDLSVSQASAQSGDEEQQQPASTTTTTADAYTTSIF
jgi:hypothetical protein